jgi:hypothetical protein
MEEPNMSEAPQDTQQDATESTEGGHRDDTPELGDAGKKAIQAEREARKAAEKTASELSARLKAIEDANLSEVERAKKAAEESAAELANLRRENVRNSVAISKGVPAELIEFLTGDTEEEVTAKADLLMSKLNTPTTPKPDLSQGAKGGDKKGTTGDQFATFFNENLHL